MSTDDLTAKPSPSNAKTGRNDDLVRRAREWARLLPDAWPETKGLVSELADRVENDAITLTEDKRVMDRDAHRLTELADEVDQLTRALHMYVGLVDGRRAERDAARAALGRVTELLTLWARLASQQANLGDVVHDLTRALEGES